MAHVQLDGGGNITGIFARPQTDNPNYAEMPDNDPRVIAFLVPPAPPKVLDTGTLAAALIAKGVLVQADINAAHQASAGAAVMKALT